MTVPLSEKRFEGIDLSPVRNITAAGTGAIRCCTAPLVENSINQGLSVASIRSSSKLLHQILQLTRLIALHSSAQVVHISRAAHLRQCVNLSVSCQPARIYINFLAIAVVHLEPDVFDRRDHATFGGERTRLQMMIAVRINSLDIGIGQIDTFYTCLPQRKQFAGVSDPVSVTVLPNAKQ